MPRPTPQAGGPPLVGCPRLLIQFIHVYPPYWRLFLHPQLEDAPCCGDRDPQTQNVTINTNLNDNPKTLLFVDNTSVIVNNPILRILKTLFIWFSKL